VLDLSMSSCCPPDSTPYLAADYAAKGAKINADGTTCYATGAADANTVILLLPDVWGWDSGRTRAIADLLADALSARCYVPKLLQPALEGGTDGDGLPPDFDIGARGAEFGPWAKQITWGEVVKPALVALLAHAKGAAAAAEPKVGVVGCCWGAWAAFHASAELEGIGAGVCFHPSAHIEAGLFGGDNGALAAATRAPFLLLPAGNDPTVYDEGGEMFAALRPGSATCRFGEMKHGWVPRGDLADEAVRRDVEKALADATAFFNAKLV
jgi:dienelactone hydrolase